MSIFGASLRFLDETDRVRRELDRENERKLFRIGAAIRSQARRLLRKSNTPSKPGEPPRTPTTFLRASVFFAVDKASQVVFIGPQLRYGSRARNSAYPTQGRTVPQVLEFGGAIRIPVRQGYLLEETIEPRPFMGPALLMAIQSGVIDDILSS